MSTKQLLGLLAWIIVVTVLLIVAVGCLALIALLGFCLCNIFKGGWVLLAMIVGTVFLGLVVEWAFKRVMQGGWR